MSQHSRHIGTERSARRGVGAPHATVLRQHDQRIGQALNHVLVGATQLFDQSRSHSGATCQTFEIGAETLHSGQHRRTARCRFVRRDPAHAVSEQVEIARPAQREQQSREQRRTYAEQYGSDRRPAQRRQSDQCEHRHSGDGRRSTQCAHGYLPGSMR